MEHDQAREALNAQIDGLVNAREEMADEQERAAATRAIDLLQDEVDRIDILAADELGGRIDEIIARLEEILEQEALDAASALGRTIRRLRQFADDPAGGA